MKKLLVLLALGAALVPFLANSGSTVLFDIPHEINYQGMLTDNEGTPLNGTYDILFKIYNHPSSGAMLWDELQEDVSVAEGLFNVVLGSVDPIDLSFYEVERYWLDITVEGEHMPSRINLTSVAFAYRAETADFAHFAAGVTEDYSDDRYVNVNGPDSVRGTYSGYMLRVKNYGTDGIYIYTPTSGSGDGIYIDSAGNYGIYVTDTGDDAVKIDDCQQRAIEITDIGNDGIYMDDIEDDGIYMEDVAGDGIWLNDIESYGIYINNAAGDGIYVDVADRGIYIDSTRSPYDGIYIDYAEDDGVHVYHADDAGFYSYDCNYGIYAHGKYGNVLDSDNSAYYAAYVYAYGLVNGNPGLYVDGTAYSTGGWGKSMPGPSGDVPAFSVSSRDVELIASGTGTLVNGQAQVTFDQEFQEAVSTEIPVRVVLTAQGAPSGLLYVASKSNQGFSVERLEIPDLAMKLDEITFDWIAIARQKGYEQRPEVLVPSEEELAAEELAEQEELEREALYRQQMLEKQAQKEAERLKEETEEQSAD